MSVGRVAAWLLLIGAVLAGVSWAASPLVAFHAFREAARAGDRDGLAELVDYGALRRSLSPQLRAAAEARAAAAARAERARQATEPPPTLAERGRRLIEGLQRRAGEVAQAPVALAPLGLDQDVERRLQPAALAVLSAGPIDHFAYVSPSRVHVQVRGPAGPLFVLERSRLFSWDVVHVELPEG